MSWNVLLFGVALPWVIVALGCWLGFQLIRQNGRILLHLEALEERLAGGSGVPAPSAPEMPPGLPEGSEAPEFELRDLAGGRRTLADFRGQRVLLIFFNPGCGFCTQMAPDLAALPTDGAGGRPIPLVVTTGDAKANRDLIREHGIRCPVLLQEQSEVASRYQAGGTPMGYLIDAEGRIASHLAAGADALLALWNATEDGANGARNGHGTKKGNRSLADSRIARSGLSVGTPAPEFELPMLDGSPLSLQQYRGRQVLLVFSDPHCGPCDLLAPQLEQLSRRAPDTQVLMVSRGDLEENRKKVAEHGLTFPVVLQRQWEISRLYAMFATPVGYLIDKEGIIAAEAASGPEAILALRASAASSTNGREGKGTRRLQEVRSRRR